MKIEDSAAGDVGRRLRRVEGQVGGIIRMLEEGRDCREVVTQLAAASKALDKAAFRLVAAGMRQCLADDPDGGGAAMTPEEMEKLFLSLT